MTGLDIRQRAAERLLEDESLTADLIDEAAKLLLDWGLAQAEAVAQQAEDLSIEGFDTRLADLRRALKRISKQVGEAASEAQAEQMRALLAEITPEREEPEVKECCADHQDL
jgi:hypothetical protein